METTENHRTALLDRTAIPRLMALSREAGWNQTPADWEQFLSAGKVYGVIDGLELVGTAAVMPYDTHAAWISMVLVSVSHRHRGIGKQLLAVCLQEIQLQNRTAYLDATPAGQRLYESLGFEGIMSITRWEGQLKGNACGKTTEAAMLTDRRVERIIALDEEVMGMRRATLITSLCRRVPKIARLTSNNESFILARDGNRALQIGPIVSNDETTAVHILNEVLSEVSGSVFVDVVSGNTGLEQKLTEWGFKFQRPFLRMRNGGRVQAGDTRRLFAIAGPEFG